MALTFATILATLLSSFFMVVNSKYITFEDLAIGTPLENQYQSEGVTFNRQNYIVAAPTFGKVVDVNQHDEEGRTILFRGTFVRPAHHYVAISFGNSGTLSPAAWLAIYHRNGTFLGGVAGQERPGKYGRLRICSDENIDHFEVRGVRTNFDRVDNLEFDDARLVFGP
ncbi:hypothetical protein BFJ63_vAg17508 [Fusarium oxysporum f. sp. narcissi]|uniref:Uncharacterized protein n=1 Tax=Fusarium oxysporum f. sp. narcissi TaxID=451672 RepID=A0A4Q2V6Q5_FUSOX|nr:hypothetical protein BFJ63_vAg17508 [Fusarium oxysporum f. sp. narcissi]